MNRELKKGTTELLILRLLNKNQSYGYELRQKIKISEATLYPTLKSLEDRSLIQRFAKSESNGRIYLDITPLGRQYLIIEIIEWKQFKKYVDGILNA